MTMTEDEKTLEKLVEICNLAQRGNLPRQGKGQMTKGRIGPCRVIESGNFEMRKGADGPVLTAESTLGIEVSPRVDGPKELQVKVRHEVKRMRQVRQEIRWARGHGAGMPSHEPKLEMVNHPMGLPNTAYGRMKEQQERVERIRAREAERGKLEGATTGEKDEKPKELTDKEALEMSYREECGLDVERGCVFALAARPVQQWAQATLEEGAKAKEEGRTPNETVMPAEGFATVMGGRIKRRNSAENPKPGVPEGAIYLGEMKRWSAGPPAITHRKPLREGASAPGEPPTRPLNAGARSLMRATGNADREGPGFADARSVAGDARGQRMSEMGTTVARAYRASREASRGVAD